MSHTHNMSIDDCLQISDSLENYSQEQIYAAISMLCMALKNTLNAEKIKDALEIGSFPANYSIAKVKESLRVLAMEVRSTRLAQRIINSILADPSILDTIAERLNEDIVEDIVE